MQVDAFVFQAAPEPFDEDVVHPTPPTVHRDAHGSRLQYAGEARRGELAALVRVEDVRAAIPCQRFNAERDIHGVRYPPGQHLPRRPVHHRNQVGECQRSCRLNSVTIPPIDGAAVLAA